MPAQRKLLKNSVDAAAATQRERTMPRVIAVGTRSPAGLLTRLLESLLARLGWLSGRVPSGVTPTLATSRWWR
jgi:hypothetical protein